MRILASSVFAFSILTTGCLLNSGGGSNEYAELYEAPTGSTTGSLFGRWGGVVEGFDTRWVLSSNRVTLANKCGARVVGIDVAAEVSSTAIRLLESDQAGGDSCFVRSVPGAFTVCSTDPFVPKDDCFIHSQKSLRIHASDVDFVSLTKLTDSTTVGGGGSNDPEGPGGDDEGPPGS